jgi:guanine deaminase
MSRTAGIRHVFKSLVMNPVSLNRVDFFNPGYLVICNGRIEGLTEVDPRPRFENAEFHDLSGLAILPGFIDTHVHLPQFPIMGIGTGPLLTWFDKYALPEEERFSDSEYALRISETFFDALVANGTTCACIYSTVHEAATEIAFEVALRKGVRAFIGKTMMDRNMAPPLLERTDASIQASFDLCSKWDGAADGRLRYVFTPRFAGACSMELMQEVGRIARERRTFIQSHLSENEDEVRWIRSLFPNRASYTDVYGFAGMLSNRAIMGHCIHLSDPEVSLLAETWTNISFCPYSNRVLHSGTMRYERLKNAGLRIALGGDVAAGPSLSMFRQMGEALNSALPASLSPAGALYLSTLGGAAVLGLADRIGNLAPGKDADFVVVDYRRVDPLLGEGHYNDPSDIFCRLCYNGDSNCVKDVYIRGFLPQLLRTL